MTLLLFNISFQLPLDSRVRAQCIIHDEVVQDPHPRCVLRQVFIILCCYFLYLESNNKNSRVNNASKVSLLFLLFEWNSRAECCWCGSAWPVDTHLIKPVSKNLLTWLTLCVKISTVVFFKQYNIAVYPIFRVVGNTISHCRLNVTELIIDEFTGSGESSMNSVFMLLPVSSRLHSNVSLDTEPKILHSKAKGQSRWDVRSDILTYICLVGEYAKLFHLSK